MHCSVAAGGGTALVATVICDVIPIVTALSRADDAVTTDVESAVRSAGVPIDGIAVIAFLVTLVAIGQSCSPEPVATSRRLAIVSAAIAIDGVAVIADFIALEDTITTAGQSTLIGAFIVVHYVAVVAVFYPGEY